MTRRMVQRGAFLLMAAALVLGISRIPTPAPAPEPPAPDDVVYVYNGYAARTDAAFDAASLDRAAYRFQHLHDLYFAGRGIYLAVVPDKALFTVPPEDYTPAGAAETANDLCSALDFLTPVDIAGGLTLSDYYRTDPHWRQEQLRPVADTLLTAMGAFVLTRKHFAIRKVCSFFILLTMFLNGGMIPTFFVVKNLGLFNSRWALILPGAISVYNMIIMRTFFAGIPVSLEEAATIEGANDWHVFLKIILPLSMPVIAVMILYYGVGHWNSWFGAMIYLRDRDKYPLQLFLREILLQDNIDSSAATTVEMAEESLFKELIQYSAILITTLPVLCIYPFLQRFFVKGVMIGAVKG